VDLNGEFWDQARHSDQSEGGEAGRGAEELRPLRLHALHVLHGVRGRADLSSRAVHKHPGDSNDCSRPCFIVGIRLHPKGQDWPLSALPFHEAESVRSRYGSRVCLPRLRPSYCSLRSLVWLHVRWAIYMVSTSQLTRSARLSWRTLWQGGPKGVRRYFHKSCHTAGVRGVM
jgi:hypothetical protein